MLRLEDLRYGADEWCLKSEAAPFYALPGSQAFEFVLDNLKFLRSEQRETIDRTVRGVDFTLEQIMSNLQAKRLDQKQFSRRLRDKIDLMDYWLQNLDKPKSKKAVRPLLV